MTWWEACPLAAPRVNAPPEIVQVSQLAPGAVQDVAPPEGGGKTLLPCARTSWANQPTWMAHNASHTIRLETCLTGFVMTCCSLFSAAPSRRSANRSEEHTSELQSPCNLGCRLLLEKNKLTHHTSPHIDSKHCGLYHHPGSHVA